MEQPSFQTYAKTLSNEIYIEADIAVIYAYVTQPDRWHEWHPTSVSAETGIRGSLPKDHRFTEVIDLLGLRVDMNYRVVLADPPHSFKTAFTSAVVDGCIQYQLQRQGRGTHFTRTLQYITELNLNGLQGRMIDLSTQAMHNLKRVMETSPHTLA
ncbi:SRPBCC family protein [Pseudomonas gingeri]|uniref:SRPBCC family protein n=1 Tax=Pseudomonas gingeri TaxID=117681 RepID=UPI0015A1DDE2|nr:SRPBCC family protein [Pseudomonas gingeri]NVZ64099.1 SRPBCC family protein [Pseudomonas gingeri]NVZ79058.1 SRPBCC family protein [Pseudomonas gingeri]